LKGKRDAVERKTVTLSWNSGGEGVRPGVGR
jgi:hypothetical protein